MTNQDENITLPQQWEEAHPVIEGWMRGTVRRRGEIDTSITGLRQHIDTRFDSLSSQVAETAEVTRDNSRKLTDTQEITREHTGTLKLHDGELARLHAQHTTVMETVNLTLTGFGGVLGDLVERTHKAEILRACMVLGLSLTTLLLVVVIWKLFH